MAKELIENTTNITHVCNLKLVELNRILISGDMDVLVCHLAEYDVSLLNDLQTIKKKKPSLPIIITSNNYLEFLSFWCLRNKIEDYVILFEEQYRLKENLLSIAECKLVEAKLLKDELNIKHTAVGDDADLKYIKTKKALQYISENYQNRIKVEQLAYVCNYSVPAFTSIFKKEHGMSPMVYLNKFRILIAKSMLITSKATIADIAYQCGFEDVAYFSKVFKKHADATPRGYRAH